MITVCKNVVLVWLHWLVVAVCVIVFSETEFTKLIDNVFSAYFFYFTQTFIKCYFIEKNNELKTKGKVIYFIFSNEVITGQRSAIMLR